MKEAIPKKYKKHKALVLLGLKTQDELDRDLTRFDPNDIEGIKKTILEKISSARVPTSYLLSLIPRDNYRGLPNCVVSSEEDFEKFEELLKANPRAIEVWAFSKEKEGSIGRFSIRDYPEEQIIEQVWSTNHRDIEHYNDKSTVPIISASRDRWYTRYTINKARNIPEEKKESYHKEFIEAVLNIERNREKIEEIAEYFKGLGIKSFSLEYTVNSKGFNFIDWDTDHDQKVISDLFPELEYGKGIEDDAR